MTSADYTTMPTSNVRILDGKDAIGMLRADLAERGPAYAWAYLITSRFCDEYIAPHLEHSQLYLITDHRQRPIASELVNSNRHIHAWTWSHNRTLHEKTFIFPHLSAVWIGSQNMTRGSWILSQNRAVRIHSRELVEKMLREWHETRSNCRAVLPIALARPPV